LRRSIDDLDAEAENGKPQPTPRRGRARALLRTEEPFFRAAAFAVAQTEAIT